MIMVVSGVADCPTIDFPTETDVHRESAACFMDEPYYKKTVSALTHTLSLSSRPCTFSFFFFCLTTIFRLTMMVDTV